MLNMAASGGNPTRIAAPVMLRFLRNRRLLSGILSPLGTWGHGDLGLGTGDWDLGTAVVPHLVPMSPSRLVESPGPRVPKSPFTVHRETAACAPAQSAAP